MSKVRACYHHNCIFIIGANALFTYLTGRGSVSNKVYYVYTLTVKPCIGKLWIAGKVYFGSNESASALNCDCDSTHLCFLLHVASE